MRSTNGFSYWVDGKQTWTFGFYGAITRLRAYITSSILIGLPLAGTPFWWPQDWNAKIEVTPVGLILLLGTITIFIFTTLFFYVRHRTDRSLEIKSKLHKLLNESNDALLKLYERHSRIRRGGRYTPIHEKQHLIEYSKQSADIIASYFQAITGDKGLGVVIRIVSVVQGQGVPESEYITVARSSALNPGRGATSEPLPKNTGFPKFFLSRQVGCMGVLFIDDITKATAEKMYHTTQNDKNFGTDFKALAVVPITGWNGVKRDLVGLLQFTSQSNKILHPKNVDLMKFSGEVLGIFYSSAFIRLVAAGAMPKSL